MKSDYDIVQEVLLGSILEGRTKVANRAALGATIPIQLFQALRVVGMGTALESMVGTGARALVYRSGQSLGELLGRAVLPHAEGELQKYFALIAKVCLQLRIGQVVPEEVKLSQRHLALRVDECVSCAGLEGADAPICNFETGMVGGLVQTFVNHPVRAVETRCNAIGDRTCGITVTIGA